MIFSLDGLGLLGFEAAIDRDYPIMFGTLYIYTLIGLAMNLVQRSHLYADRSAHRFRDAPRMSAAFARRAAGRALARAAHLTR